MRGGGGEGGTHGESTMQTYTLPCKTDTQWEFAAWLRELKLGLCDNLEGGEGLGGGRKFQEGGDICIPMADTC